VLPKYHAVIFVHGCFWHGHDCHLYKLPATRQDFWRDKISRNRDVDRMARHALLALGWRVAVVWECAIRGASADLVRVAQHLTAWLRGNEPETEVRK
jgi:DNA mismatch endonuclease (patch repair protein)